MTIFYVLGGFVLAICLVWIGVLLDSILVELTKIRKQGEKDIDIFA